MTDISNIEVYDLDITTVDDYRDDDMPAPPDDLYVTKFDDVQVRAADRVTFFTFLIPDNGVPVRIVNKFEPGVASRVTLSVIKRTGTEGFVYLLNSDENTSSNGTYNAYGYCIGSTDKASNSGSSPLVVQAAGEIYATCTSNAGDGALVSVCVENFYGN